MKKLIILFFLVVPLIASCTKEEAQEIPSEYYSYGAILGKWFIVDSDNGECYEFFKNANYVHTQDRAIEEGGFSYSIKDSTIFCKPNNKEQYIIRFVRDGQATYFHIIEKKNKRIIRIQQQ